MSDEDVMCSGKDDSSHLEDGCRNDQAHIDAINRYRESQGDEPITVDVPSLPFPRIAYCDAIKMIQDG